MTALRVMVAPPSVWRGTGLVDIGVSISSSGETYSDGNEPWKLRTGETLLDNIPTGVTRVNASDYTSSRDMRSILEAISNASTPTTHVYVQLGAGKYFINNFRDYGGAGNAANTPNPGDPERKPTPNWLGYANGNRKIIGMVGAGWSSLTGDFLTQVVASATMVSSTPATPTTYPGGSKTPMQTVLDAVPGTGIVLPGITGLYFSNNSSSKPFFFSGITFDGQFQTPFSVYSAGAQAAFDRNQTVASPIAYNGMSLWDALAGSRFQFCRLRGFGFAMNSAPPFECGAINTNKCRMLVFACELDGRVAAEFDASRRRSSGGWMWNKEIDVKMERVWVHHTRRSGIAQNTNTRSTAELYEFLNVQQNNIADDTPAGLDPWAIETSNPMGFNTPNMEGMIGTFTLRKWKANSNHSHIALAIPSGGSNPYVLPNRILVYVSDFVTDDSAFNKCLRISVSQSPDGNGTSPIYAAIAADKAAGNHINADKYFDIREFAGGPRLTAAYGSTFNYTTMNPSNSYVFKSF